MHFSTIFHPQTDSQSERTVQTLEDMLRACVLEFKDSWMMHLSLVEFANNNNYQASIGMTLYEVLYGRKCRTPVCWDKVAERKMDDIELIETTSKKIKIIRERLKAAQDQQKSYVDIRKRSLEFKVGDKVFLKIAH